MNDYIMRPDGTRHRLVRPAVATNEIVLLDGKPRVLGQTSIDQWNLPDPPDHD